MSYVLTLSCPERAGIVHAVTTFLVRRGCDITEHQQFDDRLRRTLFLRTSFDVPGGPGDDGVDGEMTCERLVAEFGDVAAQYEMDFTLSDAAVQPRLLVMVSRSGHCLNDLLFRWRSGSLGGDIALVVSNHEDLRPMAEAAGLEFVHVPVTPTTKPEAEARLLELVESHRIDLVVLARYMQVLSDGLCRTLEGRAINIHHSFLPGFKGAKPYHQAYDRGVKHVGATAHYVTPDLDEGPIIEQELARVDHTHDPARLAMVGRDTEALALSRAVTYHCQHRVLLNGGSTVVFR